MPFGITLKRVKKVPVIELTGRAMDMDMKELSKKLQGVFKKGAERIVIDLSRTTFLNSHGLGIIVYYNTLMQKEGKQLVILNDNPDKRSYVSRLFELTNLDEVMRTITSLNDL
jgi:anti-anti-sigma factor